jgi:hypothetical protein
MHEVDGVFRHDDNVAFDEELTQIIRIYFISDYDSIAKRFPSYSDLEILKFSDTFFSLSTNMYRRLQQFINPEEEIMNEGISHPKSIMNYSIILIIGLTQYPYLFSGTLFMKSACI